MHRSRYMRRQVSEVEEDAMSERDFIANLMASATTQLTTLVGIAREVKRRV